MKVRILSDLHLDQNKEFNLEDKEIFTIIAGDISKDLDFTINWIKENIHNGILIAGNHDFTNQGPTIQEVYEKLSQEFPLTSPVKFLQNEAISIENKLFVGCTLWTDFQLSNYYSFSRKLYRPLSTYIKGRYKTSVGTRPFTIKDSIIEFQLSLEFIKFCLSEALDKDVIIITHHCPSMKCSSEKYLNNPANPALISYLEPFIEENPNIKAWICGHCHRDPLDTYIGQCRLLMNPRGYTKFDECPNFNPNFIVEV